MYAGIGAAIGWTGSTVGTNFYFWKYRNLSQGFTLAGVGAGMFGLPPLVLWAESHYGSFGFFMCLACVGIHIIVCGMIMWPSKMEIYAQKKRQNELQDGSHSCMALLQHYVNILKNRVVQCVSLSSFFLGAGLFSVFVYLPFYIKDIGGSDTQGTYLLSICGFCSIIGRFGTGVIANTNIVMEIYIHAGCCFLLAINTLIFPLVSKFYSAQLVFAAVTGLTFGGPFVMMVPTNIRFLGMDKMVAATSINICLCGLGAMVGPTIAGTT